jgi:hypothetical protein
MSVMVFLGHFLSSGLSGAAAANGTSFSFMSFHPIPP